ACRNRLSNVPATRASPPSSAVRRVSRSPGGASGKSPEHHDRSRPAVALCPACGVAGSAATVDWVTGDLLVPDLLVPRTNLQVREPLGGNHLADLRRPRWALTRLAERWYATRSSTTPSSIPPGTRPGLSPGTHLPSTHLPS